MRLADFVVGLACSHRADYGRGSPTILRSADSELDASAENLVMTVDELHTVVAAIEDVIHQSS